MSRPDRFALLQAARRIDWRYLLPEPDLGAVAYVGNPEPQLVQSLTLLAASVTVVGGGEPRAAYDVAVLRDPSVAELETAAQLLRAGGWAYIESGKSVRRYVDVLERDMRFEDVDVYWHWPGFDS